MQIKGFLDRLGTSGDPRMSGKPLVGDYRIICDIQDDNILVTILRIAYRREVYREN